MKEETGLEVYVYRPVYQPELFTTNLIMKGCDLHYLTQYIPCIIEPYTPKGHPVKIDVKKPIPHAEKDKGKGDEWVWMTFLQLVKMLSGNENPLITELYDGISEEQLQWIPLPIIMHYAKELNLDIWDRS